MTPEQLIEWLELHCDKIFGFMDYEPTIDDEASLATTLGYWFGSDRWSKSGDRFVHLGIDGTGGQFAAWIRPNSTQIPVVLFGSEGGTGVVAKSCEDWAKIISYGPGIAEYLYNEEPRLNPDTNWALSADADPDERKDALKALKRYRDASVAKFGELPSFESLTDGLAAMEPEFDAWCQSMVDH